jgi:transcriptional regulator with XRE-family HTH domain
MAEAREQFELGSRIRSIRERRGLSLRVVAEHAGVSESFLSQVERGVANPSVASLRALADALDATVASFFEHHHEQQGQVVRAADRPKLIHPKRLWEDELLTPTSARKLQVIMSTVEPDQGSGDEPYAHDSDEECVIVLEGRLEFWVGDDAYVLESGDTISFESRVPHRNRNPGPAPAKVLWVTTPPSY